MYALRAQPPLDSAPQPVRQRRTTRSGHFRLAWTLVRSCRDASTAGFGSTIDDEDAQTSLAAVSGSLQMQSWLMPLAWLGAQGTRAVAAIVLVAIAAPPVDALLKPFVTPAILLLLLLAFMRVDAKLLRVHLRRPTLVIAATAWTSVGIPLLCGIAGLTLKLDVSNPELFLSLMLQSVAPPMMAAPALSALLGLDATLVLLTLVTSAALNPVTAPVLAYAFAGPVLALSPLGLGLKLFAIIAGAATGAAVIRCCVGLETVERYRREIDGINIIAMFVFVGAVMENVAADLIAYPVLVLGMAVLAFLVCFAVLGVTVAVFGWSGRLCSVSLGFMASQRNLGLMLAATGGLLPDTTWLWFALSQFPIYLTPQIMRPIVQLVLHHERMSAAGEN